MNAIVLEKETLATAGRPRAGRKKAMLVGLAVAAFGATAAYGTHWWTVSRWLESTDDAYVGGDVTAISPRVAGHVLEIPVKDNQYVHAGQLLVRIDPATFRAAVDHAKAAVEQQQATHDGLEAQYALQQSMVEKASADLAARSADALFASQDADRYQRLANSEAGSRQAAEKAVATSQSDRAAVQSAAAALAAAKQQLVVLDKQIAQSAATIAAAKAELQTAELDLGYSEIHAPIDGYVGNRAAEVGAYVSQGTYLLTIIPARGLWVDANFKEDQLAAIKAGASADVVADILPGKVFHGHVASLAPATGAVFSIIPPENATGNFTKIVQRVPVRIDLGDAGSPADGLRPGLSTNVTVDIRDDKGEAP
ncbi:MAG TPA: HlyD family secretion protein [Beijerinckiaceae bacterium]|nr:HlyD family secretion protein [Beijerinckiaceae bacterium]